MASAVPAIKDVVRDEPQAHALYDQMVAALRMAESLSFESSYRWEVGGRVLRQGTYRLWLKKPNYARLEAVQDDEVSGVLVLDGECLWIHWSKERPMFNPWDESEEEWRKTCSNVYVKKLAPPGHHSIKHEVGWFGLISILEPSVFHGYADPLEPYMDGVRSIGAEQVGEEECDGIEVSFMDHQRSWYLWLSRRDGLPRRVGQQVRLANDQSSEETWSKVTLNAAIPQERFAWAPPAGWREWQPRTFEESLLKPGTPAPDFSLNGLDGETITLSAFRGNVVWLAIWRAG